MCPGLPAWADTGKRPNIVFILVDDLRWDALGCAGHPFVKTPNIDRLAKEGALFKNYFVSIPLCSPSRASYLTGQYPHKHGVIDNKNHSELSHKLITFPRLLHDAGYTTAYVGKWHMGTDDSPRPGFDRWVSFKGQGAFIDPAMNIDGQQSKVQGYMTDLLNRHALDFVKKQHTKPFALYLAHKAVHGPFTPAERHKTLYTNDKHTLPPNTAVGRDGNPVTPMALERHDTIMRNQLRCLMAIDEGVGQLLQALEEKKQLDDTMFVFSSDNGYFWGEHGLGDKRAAYDESIRDPLLVRYPMLVKAGTRIDQFALNIDLAPTFLELAGVKVPQTMQGRSLLPLLKGDPKGWRTSFLTEYFHEGKEAIQTWQAVRTERWKYVHYPEKNSKDELYDLKADPYEMKNLLDDPASQEALRQLQDELKRQLEATK
jgi:N-acetylglucosamine-6-sulfatase